MYVKKIRSLYALYMSEEFMEIYNNYHSYWFYILNYHYKRGCLKPLYTLIHIRTIALYGLGQIMSFE